MTIRVSVINASASADTITLASGIAYIFLDAGALLDTTGQFRFVPEIVIVRDDVALAVSKSFTDIAAMNDSFDLGDGVVFTFTKSVTNIVSVQDSKILALSKGVSDMIEASDAGSLVSQNYCEFNYFAEDYVGESRTFS